LKDNPACEKDSTIINFFRKQSKDKDFSKRANIIKAEFNTFMKVPTSRRPKTIDKKRPLTKNLRLRKSMNDFKVQESEESKF